MDSATWCRTPAAASAARRLRPEVSKNSSTALSSNEGELARSITTCALAVASLSPSPVMVLTPLLGEAATTSWPCWRRMATVFEPIRPVPPMTTIFMVYSPLSTTEPLRLTNKIHAVVDPDTHESDLGSKSTRAGADGTQARARLSRPKRLFFADARWRRCSCSTRERRQPQALRRRVSVDDVVRSRLALQRGSRRSRRIVDMYEAVDALALTDNRNLLLPHLITNIALARVPGAGAVEESVT